jgi:p-hydroxybenzoic acid efflux pump subunit AaeA
VNIKDNQLVKKDQVLFVIDQPRYQKALKRLKPMSPTTRLWRRKNASKPAVVTAWRSGDVREEIDQANNVLQTVEHQLAKARQVAIWRSSIWNAR